MMLIPGRMSQTRTHRESDGNPPRDSNVRFYPLGLADFDASVLSDRTSLDLAARIDIVTDTNPDTNALTPITVEIGLKTGSSYTVTLTDVFGSPANPLSKQEHLDKFFSNWTAGAVPLPRENADRLIERIATLEKVTEIRELADLLVR